MKLTVNFLCLLLAGCGRSPLLHHEEEKKPGEAPRIEQADASGCRLSWPRGDNRLCATPQWLLPPIVGENRIRLNFNESIANATIDASADMPDMGHGTSPISQVIVDDHTIDLNEVWLIMNGRWVIRVRVNGAESSWSIEL